MSSSNKTPNIDLSQYSGSDVPSYLVDYNGDMSKIDTYVKNVKDTADGASTNASGALTKIGDLTSLSTDSKTTLVGAINEVDSHADTAQLTANAASANANTALADIAKINLTSFNDYTVSGTDINQSYKTLSVAKNSDGSLCKIYGEIRSNSTSSSALTYTTGDTGLRPESKITVQGCMLRQASTNDGHNAMYYQSFDINTDGTISFTVQSAPSVTNLKYFFMACLIFVKDFGDTPTPE